MRIIESVGSSQEDDRIETQARQPDHLHEIFLKFRAVDIPESIINTELDKKDIRPKVRNVPMPSKEVSLYLDRLITSIPFLRRDSLRIST